MVFIKNHYHYGDTVCYYMNDDNHTILHNDDGGPAYITSGGTKFWYDHGKLHNEYGPAIILENNNKWFANGINITDEVNEWLVHREIFDYTKMSDEDKIALSFFIRSLQNEFN